MNTNNKKLLSIAIGIILLIFIISMIKKNSTNPKEIGKTEKEVTVNDENTDSNLRNSKYQDFNGALEELDDPEEFYAGKDINIDGLKSAGKPMVLFFSWENCGPCKEFEPFLYEVYQERPEFVIKNIEVYKNSEFARQYPIRVTPSFIFMNEEAEPFVFSEKILDKGNFAVYSGEGGEKLFVHEGPVDKDLFQEILTEMENK